MAYKTFSNEDRLYCAEPTEKEWLFFKRLSRWEPLEACSLLCGVHPNKISFEVPSFIKDVLELCRRSCRDGELDSTLVQLSNTDKEKYLRSSHLFMCTLDKDRHKKTYLRVFDKFVFLGWAIKLELDCPFQLQIEYQDDWVGAPIFITQKKLIARNQSVTEQMENISTIDFKHEHFPDGLKAALMAWKASVLFFGSGTPFSENTTKTLSRCG